MRKGSLGFLGLAFMGALLFAVPSAAQAKTAYCYCTYPNLPEHGACGNLSTMLTTMEVPERAENTLVSTDPDSLADGSALQAQCAHLCSEADLNSVRGSTDEAAGLVTNPNAICDYSKSDNCATAKNACVNASFCFCTVGAAGAESPIIGSTAWFCDKETTFLRSVDLTTDCKALCTNAAMSGGEIFSRYEDGCDITLPDEAGTGPACRSPRRITGSCKACFCQFPADHGTEACRGKATIVEYTSRDESACAQTCRVLNLEPLQPKSVLGENEVCHYTAADGCTNPVNKDQPICQEIVKQKEAANEQALKNLEKGSVVSLSLPFSDISVEKVIGRVITQILGVVGAVGLAGFVYGGILYMTAAGSSDRSEKGRKAIVWSTLGLVVVFASYAIVRFVIEALTK